MEINKRTKYDDIQDEFFHRRTVREFSKEENGSEEVKGNLRLNYIFDKNISNNERIIEMFKKFLDMFNNIIYEKAGQFVFDYYEGDFPSVDRSMEDEENLNKKNY